MYPRLITTLATVGIYSFAIFIVKEIFPMFWFMFFTGTLILTAAVWIHLIWRGYNPKKDFQDLFDESCEDIDWTPLIEKYNEELDGKEEKTDVEV